MAGREDGRSHYDYRLLQNEDFEDCLLHKQIEKLAATGNAGEDDNSDVDLLVEFSQPVRNRKAGIMV